MGSTPFVSSRWRRDAQWLFAVQDVDQWPADGCGVQYRPSSPKEGPPPWMGRWAWGWKPAALRPSGGRLLVWLLGASGCGARVEAQGGPLAWGEAGTGARFAAVARCAVEAG